MDLPDCPPGAEGYEDTVTEVPKKPDVEDASCTKAEQEFNEHLNSLKIKLEDGSTRCMVERRGRDISGKWIYLCYPCAAVCSGENILQMHISGKKHKTKLGGRVTWPVTIFEDHPFNQTRNGGNSDIVSEKDVEKIAQEVEAHNSMDPFSKYKQYANVRCHIQDALDAVKAPLIGVEYLIEHPPEEAHYEPSYLCTLCAKQGHPRTIINHMTCFWHKHNYLVRHYAKASELLGPFRSQNRFREGCNLIITRLAHRIEDTYGRLKPLNIDKEVYERDKKHINEWIYRSKHFSEKDGASFEEVVDIDLINSLHESTLDPKAPASRSRRRDPSPPVVAAPKSQFNNYSRPAGRQERRVGSVESLSDISDDNEQDTRQPAARSAGGFTKARFEPYPTKRAPSPTRSRHSAARAQHNVIADDRAAPKQRAPNYEYKLKLVEKQRTQCEEQAKKALAYHEKNPEKHPLYPDEWKKFWNRRYKEIQAEGKDPSKHDFKPEWIVYWTRRMRELHDKELRVTLLELYRRMCLSPPDLTEQASERHARKSPEPRKSPASRRRSPGDRRLSPGGRRASPGARRHSPAPRRRSPEHRRRPAGIERHRSPPRRRTPDRDREMRAGPPRRSSPNVRRSPGRRRSVDRRRSPSRSTSVRSRSPVHRRSPARTRITMESVAGGAAGGGRRSRSPLSRRPVARNRSPERRSPLAPSLQTVLVSDDELKPDDGGLSPWNSDNEIESVCSGSMGGAPDDVVATLRLLVALEDYLGSLGPKVVDLLAEALKMEKDKPNSSEELLVRESAVVLLETAKEKLKGAVQAALLAPAALPAARAAVVRAAATLHEADKRQKKLKEKNSAAAKTAALPVAGVGEVDRAQIAQQMAEALIAQGKTDVSSEELAQLVDAVVGMAEAKKREAEKSRRVETAAPVNDAQAVKPAPAKISGTASALQMLQSAYDENDKRADKEDAPDAMDGLSDSDLETLLKNFNELSAEEQHSLIAYLKKMEAKEPERVERLRKYVTDAAAPQPPPAADLKPVLIDSDDDDDYAVEEVFQSATQKVREDQIRQEMEIVKKSLEETKPTETSNNMKPLIDFPINFSSASDLLALVQASVKTSGANSAPPVQRTEVVDSNTQPRSFGDQPEALLPNPAQEPQITAKPFSSLLEFHNSNQQQAPSRSPNQPLLERPPFNAPQKSYPQQLFNQQNSYQQHSQNNYQQDNYQQQQQDNYQQQQQDNYQQQQQDNYQKQQQDNYQQQQQQDNYQQQQQQDNYQQQQQQDNYQQQQQQDNYQQQQQQDNYQQQPPFQQQSLYQQQQFQQKPSYQPNYNYNDNRNKPMQNQQNQPWRNNASNVMHNRGPGNDMGPNMPFNQGARNNFNNNNNNQPFGNQNNFRGRGGGRGRGGQRGRGRGFF